MLEVGMGRRGHPGMWSGVVLASDHWEAFNHVHSHPPTPDPPGRNPVFRGEMVTSNNGEYVIILIATILTVYRQKFCLKCDFKN